jgi:hypothetical protein
MSITFLPTDPLAWRIFSKRVARADISGEGQKIAAAYNFGGVGKRRVDVRLLHHSEALVHWANRRNCHQRKATDSKREDSAGQNLAPGAPAKVQ